MARMTPVDLARWITAIVFIAIGVTHFIRPVVRGMAAMVPAVFHGRPFSAVGWVWVTGVAEIAGGLGAAIAAPERDVFVIVGDASYLMLSSELVTAVQLGVKMIVLVWDNGGFKSIGALSRSLGLDGFGTRFIKPVDGVLVGDSAGDAVEPLPIDFAMNARSLGCNVIECATRDDYVQALKAAKAAGRTTVVVIKNDRLHAVPGYESWWDVPVPEVSTLPSVQQARVEYEKMRAKERLFL